jgi:hypothetical protein
MKRYNRLCTQHTAVSDLFSCSDDQSHSIGLLQKATLPMKLQGELTRRERFVDDQRSPTSDLVNITTQLLT